MADSPQALPELSVVVPVKDEAENVAALIDEIVAALTPAGVAFEIVYVDDGSTDATPQILAEQMAARPKLQVRRHRVCCGQSAAIATGVAAARAPLIATLDGDGQNDPADIPALLARYREESRASGATMIAGHRAKRRDTWLRRMSSRIANGVRGGLLKDRTPDTGCGLKVFGRDAFLAMPRFDHMHRFLPALMLRGGGRVVSVPVNHRPRARGTSKYGVWNRLWVGIVDLFGVMWLARRAVNPDVETPERPPS
ncbi:MAG: glycosyltransferase [Rhodospirillaceae bacterium]